MGTSFSKHIKEIANVNEMIMKTSEQSLFKTLYALAGRNETCTRLHQIRVPVLIMVGKEDEITPPDVALLMQGKIKGSIIQIIDHAGHLSNMENSGEFSTQLTGFLSLSKKSSRESV